MQKELQAWQTSPNEDTMSNLLKAATPTIKKAVMTWGGGDSSLMARAKVLAIRALKSYVPVKGTTPETWLISSLRPLSRVAQARKTAVRLPEKMHVDLWKIDQAKKELLDRLGREPSDTEIADATGLSRLRILRLSKAGKSDVGEGSLTVDTDDGAEPFLPGTDTADPEQVWLEYIHNDSSPIDQKILEWRTGIYGKQVLPNNEIAKRLNITPSAVTQRAAKIQARVAEYRKSIPNNKNQTTGILDGDPSTTEKTDGMVTDVPV